MYSKLCFLINLKIFPIVFQGHFFRLFDSIFAFAEILTMLLWFWFLMVLKNYAYNKYIGKHL